jgi:uncharacterized protein YyaL (SSP411 family)
LERNRTPNRLINEKSPYLLQHAYNPVDWYPWGEEAFARAAAEDKPVFLSVGYAACHWCHVMERESFEDEEVGNALNQGFISVKVDREERPDVDALSMAACLALTGSGGWPTTVLMTPDREPFFAGTYFPRDSRGGHPGLLDILSQVSALWKTDRDTLMESGRRLTEHLRRTSRAQAGLLGMRAVREGMNALSAVFDSRWGGFGSQPKFPTPHNIMFLLRCAAAGMGEGRALDMAERSLWAMARGGIFDAVGGGFARYSTDRRWIVPHFEKMLYDNALLAMAYCEAYAMTGKGQYRETAQRTFEWVLRDMTDPDGGFYSALDADSEGEEGRYYLWDYEELRSLLEPDQLDYLKKYYSVTPGGNFEGKNLLHRVDAPELPEEGSREHEAGRAAFARLLEVRSRRTAPHLDDKILSGWNGLMIAALAAGSRLLGEPGYADAARRAAGFIAERMTDREGRLRTRFRDGELSKHGFFDDGAYMTWGMLELFEATGEPYWLHRAVELTESLVRDFWDEGEGGFFLSAVDNREIPLRVKERYDGALPSGNSVEAMNLTRLYRLTGDSQFERRAWRVFEAFGGDVTQSPSAHIHMLSAWITHETAHRQLVLAGRPADARIGAARKSAMGRFLPFATVLVWDGNPELSALIPLMNDIPWDGEPAAYVCRDFSCQAPTRDLEAAVSAIGEGG